MKRSLMRGDQLSRQWRVLRKLEVSRMGLTATEIAEEGRVSLRTAYRDMDDLQLAGFPIYTEKEGTATRWRLMEGFHFNIPEPFTLTELLCLLQRQGKFQPLGGHPSQNVIRSAVDDCMDRRDLIGHKVLLERSDQGDATAYVRDTARETLVALEGKEIIEVPTPAPEPL